MQDKTQPIAIEQLVKRLNGFIYVSTDLRIFFSRGYTIFSPGLLSYSFHLNAHENE